MLTASDIAQSISDKMIEVMGLNFGHVGEGGSTVTILNKMLYFSSNDLNDTIESFTDRIIKPAIKDFRLEWDRQRYEIPNCLDFSLNVPVGVDFAYKYTQKGLHVRVIRVYDVGMDRFPCRVTVAYR